MPLTKFIPSHNKIKNLKEIVDTNPTHIWIEPTSRCNTRCKHCGHYYHDFGEDMGEDIYQKIKNSILNDVKRIDLFGYGEPFIAKNFDQMFDECTKRNIAICITTNGICLRDDKLVSKLVRNNVHLVLSFEGAKPETYEFIRPYIKWEKMIETLECIKRNANSAGAEKRFKLSFNFLLIKKNINDLTDIVQLAARYGAEEVSASPLGGIDSFEEIKNQSIYDSLELIQPILIKSLKIANKLGVKLFIAPVLSDFILNDNENGKSLKSKMIRLFRKAQLGIIYIKMKGIKPTLNKLFYGFEPKPKIGLRYCYLPWEDCFVSANGNVFPCCIMGDPLGNLKNQEWNDIWYGSLYKNLRRTVHSWNPTAVCRYCPYPLGILGGDEKYYEKFFSKYKREEIPLNSPDINYGEGFYDLEYKTDGSPSHRWMRQKAKLILPMKENAKFIRFSIIPHFPPSTINPGKCTINNTVTEPFDNTCLNITFPIDFVKGKRIELEFEMENKYKIDPDPRELSLAISEIQYLS